MKLVYCDVFQAAYQSGEDEVNLSTMGRTYTIDFNAMQQINEDTGTARPVQRTANPLATPGSAGAGREGPLSRTSIYTLLSAWIDVDFTSSN